MYYPDFGHAQDCAYKTVYDSNQESLPLSIKKLIKSFPNLYLQKYTVFAKKRELSLQETFEILDSEEGCLWRRNDNTYIILYNDLVKNTGRIRFTLAHELGHFILKHHEKTDKTILSRYSLSDDEYDVFEKEANYFAKRLLAPVPLIDLYTANWNEINADTIEWAFDVSRTVSHFIINELSKRKKNTGIIRIGHPMVDNFIDYINMDTRSQICLNCKTRQLQTNSFCRTCGESKFIASTPKNYPTFYSERKIIMNYSKIETNDNNTPIQCPKCHSEGLEDNFNYCPWCATFIHNICLGSEDYRYYQDSYNNMIEHSLLDQSKNGCGKYLDGGYRYCPDCGSETSYFHQKILLNWETESKQQNDPFTSQKFNELPF